MSVLFHGFLLGLFLMEVNFPLPSSGDSPLRVERAPAQPVDPVWQRAREKLYSPGARRRRSPAGAETISFDQFQEDLLRTLKHAANIRHINPNEKVILTVLAQSDAASPAGGRFLGASGFSGRAGGGYAGGGSAGGFSGGGGFGAMGGSGRPGQNWSQFKSWSWPPGTTDKTPGEMTDGEAICAQLQDLMRDPGAFPEEVAQKVAALRQIRQAARQRLARVRKALRETLAPPQETPLIAMGYLD